MNEPIWVMKSVVLAIHAEQLAEHGGESGLRDDALLESALTRPLNIYAYGAHDSFDLAAAYACGIMQNHPFIDGNKRTAFVTSHLFLYLNNLTFVASREEKVTVFLKLASNQLNEHKLALWFKNNHNH